MRQPSATWRDRSTPLPERSSASASLIARAAPGAACRPACATLRRSGKPGRRPRSPRRSRPRERPAPRSRPNPRSARPSLVAIPVMTIWPSPARSSASVGVASVIRTRSWARTSSRTSLGANASRTRPGAPAYSGDISPGSSVTRSEASLSIWWRQTDERPIRRTTIAVSPVWSAEHAQRRVGMTDELLAADVGAGPDEELRAEPDIGRRDDRRTRTRRVSADSGRRSRSASRAASRARRHGPRRGRRPSTAGAGHGRTRCPRPPLRAADRARSLWRTFSRCGNLGANGHRSTARDHVGCGRNDPSRSCRWPLDHGRPVVPPSPDVVPP